MGGRAGGNAKIFEIAKPSGLERAVLWAAGIGYYEMSKGARRERYTWSEFPLPSPTIEAPSHHTI